MDLVSLLYLSLGILMLSCMLSKALTVLWWNPLRIQKHFLDQGIRGPGYRLLFGNLKEIAQIHRQLKLAPPLPPPSESKSHHYMAERIFPHVPFWSIKYGKNFLLWIGPSPLLVVTDLELIKRMFSEPYQYFITEHRPLRRVLGESLPLSVGDEWANRRRLLSPLFNMEALKDMSQIMTKATNKMVDRWSEFIKLNDWEVDVLHEFEELAENTAAIIIFGKDAELGKQIGHLQKKLQDVTSAVLRIACIPGSRFIPNSLNSKCAWLKKEVDKLIKELIKSRYLSKDEQENDFLGFLLSSTLTQKKIEDECRVFSTAGYETISIALSWAFILLGTYTEWQDKAREEIDEVLKGNQPSFEILGRLKILNMIVNETLRLYPPVPLASRETKKDIRLEDLDIPGGTTFAIPIIAIHYDKEIWGDNAAEFDPSRFAQGASKSSKHPRAFMPFTHGPRTCLGMNFALMEIRLVLAMILQRFTFITSPTYKHDPVYTLTMKPGKGAPIIFKKI